MIGGKVWERLPVYMTSSNPVNAKKMGFVGGKIPCPYGPSDGDIGILYKKEQIINSCFYIFFTTVAISNHIFVHRSPKVK